MAELHVHLGTAPVHTSKHCELEVRRGEVWVPDVNEVANVQQITPWKAKPHGLFFTAALSIRLALKLGDETFEHALHHRLCIRALPLLAQPLLQPRLLCTVLCCSTAVERQDSSLLFTTVSVPDQLVIRIIGQLA